MEYFSFEKFLSVSAKIGTKNKSKQNEKEIITKIYKNLTRLVWQKIFLNKKKIHGRNMNLNKYPRQKNEDEY